MDPKNQPVYGPTTWAFRSKNLKEGNEVTLLLTTATKNAAKELARQLLPSSNYRTLEVRQYDQKKELAEGWAALRACTPNMEFPSLARGIQFLAEGMQKFICHECPVPDKSNELALQARVQELEHLLEVANSQNENLTIDVRVLRRDLELTESMLQHARLPWWAKFTWGKAS